MGVWPSLVYGACLENKRRLIAARGFKSYRSRQKSYACDLEENQQKNKSCLHFSGVMTHNKETRLSGVPYFLRLLCPDGAIGQRNRFLICGFGVRIPVGVPYISPQSNGQNNWLRTSRWRFDSSGRCQKTKVFKGEQVY